MYFSPNKKASERRTNDEYLRRSSFGARASSESLPTQSDPPTDAQGEANATCLTCQNEEKMPSLAMVYAPKQIFKDLYEPNEALERGTLFRALDLPFHGRSVKQK